MNAIANDMGNNQRAFPHANIFLKNRSLGGKTSGQSGELILLFFMHSSTSSGSQRLASAGDENCLGWGGSDGTWSRAHWSDSGESKENAEVLAPNVPVVVPQGFTKAGEAIVIL
jgi:hypothetical protein